MTITAMLLASKFYILSPSNRFKYATLGLLFVSVSIGGTLTHFAAPPVLMVAGPWNWDITFMFAHFGLKSILAIVLSTTAYVVFFRKELKELSQTFQFLELKETVKHRFLDRAHFESKLDLVLQENDITERFTDGINQRLKEISRGISTKMRKRFLDAVAESTIQPTMAEQAFDEVYSDVVKSRLQRKLPGVLPSEKRAPWIDPDWDNRDDPVPVWVIIVHLMFIVWTVVNAHHPQLFIPGLLFFLAFANITEQYQNRVNIRGSLLVGFFLGGLVIHGGLQGWWIEPVLGSLSEVPLMLTATLLTAFNDNSAITYLSTLVPNFSEGAKYAVVAGAVAGGGLTVIANAPNPAGQSILKHHFDHGVSALSLMLGALVPTIIAVSIFLLIH
jgi:Na+/H+ antiporter NhaD/arsenite permease-like protein